MSLWSCPEHFITGPEACCPLACRVQLNPRAVCSLPLQQCPSWDSCDEYGCRHPKDGPQHVVGEPSIAHGHVPIPAAPRVLDFDPTERAARARIAKLLGRDPGGYAAFMIDDKPVTAIQFLAHLTATAPVDAERDPQPVRLSGPVH